MKRSGPIASRTPLKRSTTPLRRGATGQRGTMARSPMKARGTKGHRFPKLVDLAYRRWVKGFPCFLACHPDHQASCKVWPVDPAHVKSRGSGGADRGNILPMCRALHDEHDHRGVKSFAKKYDVNPKELAGLLELAYGRSARDMGLAELNERWLDIETADALAPTRPTPEAP